MEACRLPQLKSVTLVDNTLPSHLQEVSEPFGESAQQIEKTLPSNPEKTTALRKLLEAKDCTVWALPLKTEDQPQKEAA
jgi:hypothetical protein